MYPTLRFGLVIKSVTETMHLFSAFCLSVFRSIESQVAGMTVFRTESLTLSPVGAPCSRQASVGRERIFSFAHAHFASCVIFGDGSTCWPDRRDGEIQNHPLFFRELQGSKFACFLRQGLWRRGIRVCLDLFPLPLFDSAALLRSRCRLYVPEQ